MSKMATQSLPSTCAREAFSCAEFRGISMTAGYLASDAAGKSGPPLPLLWDNLHFSYFGAIILRLKREG